MSAVADGVGCGLCALTGAWRGEAAEPPTHSIADGTALRCGRVGSRHFRKPRDSSRGFFVLCLLRYSLHVAVLYRGNRCVLHAL